MKQKFRQHIAGLLALVMLLSVIPMTASAAGAASDLSVGTFAELQAFAEAVNGGETFAGRTVTLTVNVYLGGESNPWKAIGTSSHPFKGTFDGNGHVISGLSIASGSSVGFFGEVDGGTVKNPVVCGEVTGSSNVAGVVGKLTAGKVTDCGNEATVSGGSGVGGVVGYVNRDCTVSGCYNRGDISGTTGFIGGVTGQHWRAGVVENCYNAGRVTGPAPVGGVAGGHKAASPVLRSCYNAGSVVDSAGNSNNIGAVLGGSRGGSNTNCYYLAGTGASSKDGITEVTALTAAMLGNAFTDGDGLPALAWESSVSADTPVRPEFVEGTERSAQLAAYIRAAVKSAKTHGGVSGTLLGSEKFTSGASSTATDWLALAMGRFGHRDGDAYVNLIDDGTGYADYLAAMKAYIEKTYAKNNGALHSVKATEWHRAVVAIAALGGDPTDFGTCNGQPINLIADGSYNCVLKAGPGGQGINGWIWGLIAMDTGSYAIPADAKYSRETFITEILKLQLTDGVQGNAYGGWVLGGFGSRSDADITAMAIQALAPYYNDDTVYTYVNENSKTEVSRTVRQCVNEALDVLGTMQNENGGFASWGTDNVESVSQVVVALTALGINPAEDARFITRSGRTLFDGMLRFLLPDGGFCHVKDGGWNAMANDQAAYALVSYWRLENGLRALYDMRAGMTEETGAAIRAAKDAIRAADDPTAADYRAQLKAALALFRAVPAEERRYVGSYNALASAVELVGGEAALDTDAPYIVSIGITKHPDKTRYTEGELFDPAGMTVTATYNDGHTAPVTDYRLSHTGKLVLGDTAVTVICGILRAELPIEVLEWMPWEGDGSTENPYRIGTAAELCALAEKVNKGNPFTGVTFVMTANLDLSGISEWTPIGKSSGTQFDGVFDGQGYVIDNLVSTAGGLFGYVCRNAVIRNVGVASGEIGAENLSFMGAIAKWSNGADFINCWSGADILCSGWSGGIVGTVRDGGESIIKGCSNVGTVTARDGAVGGIVGHLAAGGHGTEVNVTVTDCYNAGTVTAADNAGGIVGRVQDGHSIRNCYNVGKISVTGENILDGAGGIASLVTSGNTVSDCYYLTDRTSCGISNGNDTTEGKTAEELRADEMLSLLGESFKRDPYGLVNAGFPLLAWQKTGDADAVDAVRDAIAAIGDVTKDSADAVRAAREAYNALPEDLRKLVENAGVLTAAEAALEALRRPEETDETRAPDPAADADSSGGSEEPVPLGCASGVTCGLWLAAVLGMAAAGGFGKRRR